MATVFKNVLTTELGTTPATVLSTNPTATTTVIGMSLTNTTAGTIQISVQVTDNVVESTAYFVKNIIVPSNNSVRLINGGERLVLGPDTDLILTSNTDASVDAVISYVEIS
jgi:hypothetical protein